jgi:cytochrome b involved in lipid metabolism
MNKKQATISLFIFWAVVVSILTAGLVYSNNPNRTNPSANDSFSTGAVAESLAVQENRLSGVDRSAATLTLSSSELVKHNSASSCWLLVSTKIYDVTNFIRQHPGGANEIIPTCGTDATVAFASRGGTGSHSSSAQSMLSAYYIGELNQTVTQNQQNSTASNSIDSSASGRFVAPNPVLPSNMGDDDEDEFEHEDEDD